MAKDRAKLRIDGDSGGATKANAKLVKGLGDLGKAGQKAGKAIAQGAKQASKEEKSYEAEVQKAIQRLKRKEVQAKATAEAVRRSGGEVGSGRRGLPRPVAQNNVSQRPQLRGAFENVARVGGAGGGMMGNIASSMGAGGGLAALGVGATAVAGGLQVLRGRIQAAAEAAQQMAQIEGQRADAIKQGQDALGRQVLQTAGQFAGEGMGALSLDRVKLEDVSETMDRTGLNQQISTQVAAAFSGFSRSVRARIQQVAKDAAMIGRDPVAAAREARNIAMHNDGKLPLQQGTGVGHGGDYSPASQYEQDRMILLRATQQDSLANYSDARIRNAVGDETSDAYRVQGLNISSNQAGVAAVNNLSSQEALHHADRIAMEDARATADPVAASLKEFNKGLDRQIKELEAIREGIGSLGRIMDDTKNAILGGNSGYGGQARNLKAARGF